MQHILLYIRIVFYFENVSFVEFNLSGNRIKMCLEDTQFVWLSHSFKSIANNFEFIIHKDFVWNVFRDVCCICSSYKNLNKSICSVFPIEICLRSLTWNFSWRIIIIIKMKNSNNNNYFKQRHNYERIHSTRDDSTVEMKEKHWQWSICKKG